MATIVKPPLVPVESRHPQDRGWPTSSTTFRTKRDAEDWARRTEDEMVRGVRICLTWPTITFASIINGVYK